VAFDAALKSGDTLKRGMRAPAGSTDRQDCRSARRSRLKGEVHGCTECIPLCSASFNSVDDARLWWPRRPLATLDRKSRQGRKAATVSVDAGAEVSRRGHRLFCRYRCGQNRPYRVPYELRSGDVRRSGEPSLLVIASSCGRRGPVRDPGSRSHTRPRSGAAALRSRRFRTR